MFELEPTPSSRSVLREWAEEERRRRQLFNLRLSQWLAEVEINQAAADTQRRMQITVWLHSLEKGR